MLDKKLINELYRHGHRKAEIAHILGVSRQRIHLVLAGYKPPKSSLKCTICWTEKAEKTYTINGKSILICQKCFVELKRTHRHKWNKKYAACIECNTTEIPHEARGLCHNCYRRVQNFKQKRFLV